ncbi:MAG: peptidase MA family metallohydrolase [Moorellaceae bacterium]
MGNLWRRYAAKFCLISLLLAEVALWRHLSWARTLGYKPLVFLARQRMEWQTRDWLVAESEHFRLKYRPEDASIVPVVLETAEEAYVPATEIFHYQPRGKTLVLIYPDRQSLAQQFGWAADESAMGVYWAGVVRILSPLDWLPADHTLSDTFKAQGPVLHEFSHLLVDELARGNYPRWLTEGLAQYVERQVTGYQLPGPEPEDIKQWYSLYELDTHFDRLPDQAVAYRQSLMMVDYLIDRTGWEGVRRLLLELGRGASLEEAIKEATGLELTQLPAPLFTLSS